MQHGQQMQRAPDPSWPGFFDCFDDIGTCCCVSCYLAWCVARQTHERAGLKSGPAWKIPPGICISIPLMCCCGLGIIPLVLTLKSVVEGRGELQTLAGQPVDDTQNWGIYCCGFAAFAICQVCQSVSSCPRAHAIMELPIWTVDVRSRTCN